MSSNRHMVWLEIDEMDGNFIIIHNILCVSVLSRLSRFAYIVSFFFLFFFLFLFLRGVIRWCTGASHYDKIFSFIFHHSNMLSFCAKYIKNDLGTICSEGGFCQLLIVLFSFVLMSHSHARTLHISSNQVFMFIEQLDRDVDTKLKNVFLPDSIAYLWDRLNVDERMNEAKPSKTDREISKYI